MSTRGLNEMVIGEAVVNQVLTGAKAGEAGQYR